MPRKFMRRPRRKIIRRRRVFRRKPSKFLKRTIQKIISKNVEDKIAYLETGSSLVYYNSGINSSADLGKIIPDIANGSTEQHRIGARIRAKTLVIRGYMQLAVDTAVNDISNKRVGVRLMVLGSKKHKFITDLQNTAGANLLMKGSSAQTFNGNISDLWTPINTEEWTAYYDKVHYLSQSYVREQVGSSTPTQTWAMDVSKGIKFFTIRIPVRGKLLMFETGTSSNQATNWSAAIACGYAHLDGSSPDVVSTKVGLCYDCTLTYEDA